MSSRIITPLEDADGEHRCQVTKPRLSYEFEGKPCNKRAAFTVTGSNGSGYYMCPVHAEIARKGQGPIFTASSK